ncbi:hypothetical protein MNBD_GAMMA03-1222 [hydrothermal vent metagenome]|uniref:DUF3465 domain-containing protein n=1 Tax=hydrothermal vent metagenome TaxID=652676 RepID=A0A3B0VTS9_9ZZZZ
MKKLFIVLLIGVGTYGFFQQNPNLISAIAKDSAPNHQIISDAYQNQLSDIQVRGTGRVSKVLRDDNKGSRHQKFILRLPSGQTILIAHNIDLAPRIPNIRKGDSVEFYGEYEWTEKGGVVHWTHHDPRGQHIDGWLKHNGRTYE